jgi:hypothetical protein
MRTAGLFTALTVFVFCSMVQSQTWEFGFTGGVSYYVGDLNPDKHFSAPHPAGTLYFRRNFGKHWSIRTSLLVGKVSGDDSLGSYDYQIQRNLRFESWIAEAHSVLEFHFFPYIAGDVKKMRWTPYLFVGIGAFYFNPQSHYNGELVNLSDLTTEGQETPTYPDRVRYPLVNLNIPFGMGFKVNLSERIAIGMQYGMRMLFTDYLDDVSNTYTDRNELLIIKGQAAAELSDLSPGASSGSHTHYQRGFWRSNDWYGYLGLSLSIVIGDATVCAGYKIKKRSKFRR